MTSSASPLRLGILGAARIAPAALIRPARHVAEARVVAVAARDRDKAARFAQKHGIETAHGSYEALLGDANVDAVYNPLPNGLHGRWTRAALAAAKHVLCEKPFTANADEAAEVAAAAAASGRVVMEAFHYRYHPLALRAREILDAHEIGRIRRVETWLCFPLPRFSDIRYDHALAGGALMDAGCYAVHMARFFGGEEPEVVSATAKLRTPDVDRAMRAEVRYPSGHTGVIHCSMWSSTLLRIFARVEGEHGELRITNPVMPQLWHKLVVVANGKRRVERVSKRPTYEFQLQAFCDAVLRGAPTLTPPSDAVANMRVIDAIYRAAGMHPRQPSA
ncbi:MAG TPA: Gfo/Idh/MocA family oxidoreductase [Polyangia bacterium]|nr:Gfo/Idh/MocA family oxidoreductase [Polyangia bacterium]